MGITPVVYMTLVFYLYVKLGRNPSGSSTAMKAGTDRKDHLTEVSGSR